MLRPRLYYDTCISLLGHGSSLQTDRSTSMYIHDRDQTDNPTHGSTWWVPTVREDKEALPSVRRYSWWVPAIREDKEALPSVRRYSWCVPAVRGKNHFFCP